MKEQFRTGVGQYTDIYSYSQYLKNSEILHVCWIRLRVEIPFAYVIYINSITVLGTMCSSRSLSRCATAVIELVTTLPCCCMSRH